MREINTQFGKIFIKDYDESELDCFAVFDSDGRYMDEYSTSIIHNKENYEALVKYLENAPYMDMIVPSIEYRGTKDEMNKYMDEVHGCDEVIWEDGLPHHDWINRIGEEYILIQQ